MAVLWGEQDTLIPITHGQAFAQSMQGVVFKSFAGNGHHLHRERPAAFVESVRGFLDEPCVPRVRPLAAHSAAPSLAARASAALRRMAVPPGPSDLKICL